jgi:hypothetical protein
VTENKERVAQSIPRPGDGEMSEDEIDRNLTETFPASDPPSWTLGTDHREESPSERRDDDDDGGGEAG